MGSSLNDSLETVLSVRELSDGRVIAQAPGNHVLLVYDTAFARADTLLGGGGSAAQAYPAQLALPIIAGPADTTLLVDRSGEVTARVRLPNGAAIVGFGVGCVYLARAIFRVDGGEHQCVRLGHRGCNSLARSCRELD